MTKTKKPNTPTPPLVPGHLKRGQFGGAEHCNVASKFGKYQVLCHRLCRWQFCCCKNNKELFQKERVFHFQNESIGPLENLERPWFSHMLLKKPGAIITSLLCNIISINEHFKHYSLFL